MIESLRGVELAKCFFSRDCGFDGGWPIDPYVFAVLSKETLQVTGVVRLELALYDGNWIQRGTSCALTFALSGAPLFGASALERVVSRHWFRQPLFCRTNWRKPAKAVAGPNRPALRYS